MERNIQKNGLVNLLVLVAVCILVFAASHYANAFAGQITSAFLALGILAAAVSCFQMGLEERERLEKLEFDEMTRGGTSSGLFVTQEAESFPARRSREQFEKFFVPGFTLVLLLVEAAGAYFLWQWLGKPPSTLLLSPTVGMAILGLAALVLFLMGKYSAGLVRLEKQRLLQPGASYLLLGAYLCALAAAGIAVTEAGFPLVDVNLARGLCGLLAILAAENLVTLLLELYRPRIKGKVSHLLYDSRLVGLLSRPEGIFTTAAHALDYQFGFKVSETWFYQFLQRAFAWLLLAQFGLLLLSTCFVFIDAGEEALLERFGKPVAEGVIGPGAHLKLPWPIDRVYRFRTQEIQSFDVGFVHDEKDDREKTVLWTVSHYKEEFHLLVANRESAGAASGAEAAGKKNPPVNILSAGIPVQFQISDLRAWAYNYTDAAQMLEKIGTREVVRYLVSADLQETMSSGRFQAGEELRKRIQERADELELGAKIIFVGLQDVHPPVKVAASYEAVVGARQKREANILAARAHEVRTNALATAQAFVRKRQAEATRQRLESATLARAVLFTNQIPAFHASPSVYSTRGYLQALTRGGDTARKVILVTTNTDDVILLDLEEKISPDLLGGLSMPKAK